jgi:hypothetical protein
MDTNNTNAGDIIPMTPSVNGSVSEQSNVVNNMSNLPTDKMDAVRRAINSYQPRTEFGRNALRTLLYASDEIHDITPTEQEVNYSILIDLLREDFLATSFVTQEAINGDGPVLSIIRNALLLSVVCNTHTCPVHS